MPGTARRQQDLAKRGVASFGTRGTGPLWARAKLKMHVRRKMWKDARRFNLAARTTSRFDDA
jgi:hypothetical protein